MFDRKGIYKRVMAQYSVVRPVELARRLGIKPQVVLQWKDGIRQVPWLRLKALVDEHDLSWDWLLEGREPEHWHHAKKTTGKTFDRKGINDRFLSLYPDCSQNKLGKVLRVNGTTIFKWRNYLSQVPWKRLKHAVDTKGVTWDWLIEGR